MIKRKESIVGGGIVAAITVTIVLVAMFSYIKTNIVPDDVTISGYVHTVGYKTFPVSVDYVSQSTGHHIKTLVNSDGYYSVSVRNNDGYRTDVSWNGLLDGGICNGGELSFSNSGPTLYRDIIC
jgi:hypothetical protein